MPVSRFWSSVWTVVGFLLLLAFLQGLADRVAILFGLLPWVAPGVAQWALAVSRAVVPIWGALTYVDWRWGWKSDNAGLRQTPAARFWLLPGLAGGLALAGAGFLIANWGRVPQPDLAPVPLLQAALAAVALFGTELIFRGILASRFAQDLSGREALLLTLAGPVVWGVFAPVIGQMFLVDIPHPSIDGLGAVALSLLLSLLFLQTQSAWLVAGVHIGLDLGRRLLGLAFSDAALFLVSAVPAAVLFWLEYERIRRIRRPGPRGGPRRVVYGKTVRGPWGQH
ncbi:hypothetical protein J2Z79_000351 [Symbiobacterium terraclitae]|uniref:CAAX prenyl protease 2/Lysostaphin resistance protein A-like domain-containing protein n=1 Tax=Symbiobacterium terraclitae TaxID=557451 RepID=A0ABS4JN74_9FIRM|nr:CPBP family glutamic-type intramembrane protease [Symbiobacterium terraclitae]MBP2016977.1 hypothetical protein [Symbiobacterium terraclitae]